MFRKRYRVLVEGREVTRCRREQDARDFARHEALGRVTEAVVLKDGRQVFSYEVSTRPA